MDRIESERSLVRLEFARSRELSRPEPFELDRGLPDPLLSRPRREELGWLSPMYPGLAMIRESLSMAYD